MRSAAMFLLKPFLWTGNRVVKWLLRSRLHWLLSSQVVLLEITGRKTGKQYLVPVNYRVVEDDARGATSARFTEGIGAASPRPGRAGDQGGGSRVGTGGGGPQAATTSQPTTITVLTYRRRKWWRNLRDGDTIYIHLRGKRLQAHVGLVLDDLDAIAQALTERGWVRKAVADAQARETVLIRLGVSGPQPEALSEI